ncbi:MAG: hypothetical protein U9R79_08930 [Armatimonadota bacterium]|nr:hypothetical protein [Armatimonadota bacterium]
MVEAILVLAVLAGLHWIGGWQGAALLGGFVVLLVAIPWLGDFTLLADSGVPAMKVRLAWWGSVTVRERAQEREVLARVLGIPWRRRIGKERPEAEPPEARPEAVVEEAVEPAVEPAPVRWWKRLDAETAEGVAGLALSGLRTAIDLVWDASEVVVVVSDAAQREAVDRAVESLFGRRAVGPVDLTLSHRGERRRVRVRYRIGLLRAALAALQVMVEGRPVAFAREMRRQKAKRTAKLDSDRELIEEILQQQEDDGDGGV